MIRLWPGKKDFAGAVQGTIVCNRGATAAPGHLTDYNPKEDAMMEAPATIRAHCHGILQ